MTKSLARRLHALGAMLWIAYERWKEDGGTLLAGSLAYFTAVSFFPMLLLLLSATGWFFELTDLGQDAHQEILEAIGNQFSDEFRAQVETVFDDISENASITGPLGLLALLVLVTTMFSQISYAFDRIWNVHQGSQGRLKSWVRNILFLRLKAFLMFTALMIIVFVIFLSGMLLSTIERWAGELFTLPTGSIWLAQLLVSFLLNALIFSLIYYLVPNARVEWRAAAWGGLLAGFIWEIGRFILALIVVGQRYNSAFGVVGAFLAMMLWLFYAAIVIIYCAEVTQTLSEAYHFKKIKAR